jgi:hypothetical protein
MNCPNCQKPAESKIVDGLEIVNCSTCGPLQINKDGSSTPLTELPSVFASEAGPVAGGPGNGESAALADKVEASAESTAVEAGASTPAPDQPSTVDLDDQDETEGGLFKKVRIL